MRGYIVLAVLGAALFSFPALAQLTPEEALGQKGLDFLDSLGAGWAVAAILVARQVAEVAAKLIPDSSTGVMGVVRKGLKLFAVYVPNQK